MADSRDAKLIEEVQNTARYSVEHRAVSWMLLLLTLAFGIWGYQNMPKQRDPTIPVRVALAVTAWPGADAREIEQQVTRMVEQAIAGNPHIHPPATTQFGIRSWSLPGISLVQVNLDESVQQPEEEFSDIELRLNAIETNLPKGAGPVQWHSGVGETSALMLTIASPIERATTLAVRARALSQAIADSRPREDWNENTHETLVVMLPTTTPVRPVVAVFAQLARAIEEQGLGSDTQVITGDAFVGIDLRRTQDQPVVLDFARRWLQEQLGVTNFHPDAWEPFVVGNLSDLDTLLRQVAGPKYSHHQLAQFAQFLSSGLAEVPQVSKVLQSGVLNERIFMVYSQETLAQLGIPLQTIPNKLSSQNSTVASGTYEIGTTDVPLVVNPPPTPRAALSDLVIGEDESGAPVRLEEIGELFRGYQSPPILLNSYGRNGPSDDWIRTPAMTLSIQMRDGQQIAAFGEEINRVLAELEERLPEDLVIARTSDQPRQVRENLDLFLEALYEAIALVVLIAFIGFRDWRASLLLMFSIPLTIALTFGAASLLGLALQQVSIASLIIALGLLVDDPVVASDAIKRSLGDGQTQRIAAWLGPTKLARAILFATITNVIAYLPFVLLTGNTGDFIRSLPLMMACALIASRLVSMTFIPFLGQFLLKAPADPSRNESEGRLSVWYAHAIRSAVIHRRSVLIIVVALVVGVFILAANELETSFFPDDIQYLATVDVFLPTEASVVGSADLADEVGEAIRQEAVRAQEAGEIKGELVSLTRFAGGGGPRFWQTLTPQPTPQSNYAQIIIEITDKNDMPRLAPLLQQAINRKIAGAWVDVRQLQTNPVSNPIEIRLTGRTTVTAEEENAENRVLRSLADELTEIVRSSPSATRVRQDWLNERFASVIEVDADQASIAGVSNTDVAHALQAATNGVLISYYREGNERIPVVAIVTPSERPQLSSLGNVYVYGETPDNGVPLSTVARTRLDLTTQRIGRRDHFRTISVIGFPRSGSLASTIMKEIEDPLASFETNLPPGIQLQIGGEQAKAQEGFSNLVLVLAISAAGIFAALVFQFSSLIKPLMVFAGVPFGFAGGLLGLIITGEPFSFMAFLGLIALVGVIVSHVIVLFDFIEEMRLEGRAIEEALVEACVLRLRPVLITVGATVTALIPLAVHGGPLWQSLCYAQIGGLTVATAISLLIVPILYAVCVEDLEIIRWESNVES